MQFGVRSDLISVTLARLQGFSDISGGVFVFVSISVLALLADPYTVVARLSQFFLSVFWCKRLIFFHPLGSPSIH